MKYPPGADLVGLFLSARQRRISAVLVPPHVDCGDKPIRDCMWATERGRERGSKLLVREQKPSSRRGQTGPEPLDCPACPVYSIWFNPLNQTAPAMSVTVNIHEAKTHLPRLVDQAAKGREFVIGKAGKPMVRVVPIHALSPNRTLGFLAGKGRIAADLKSTFAQDIDAIFSPGR